eukprot:TRINITY_DN12670_c0_g1_i2.p1 TRINITY_DN12670_c0_g1~~TRINITY_DN12670_c0_g1_i2.p1  ORF type:complete len:448 (+),score=75.59 TRINITY_DN12670_c0_g1_i2:65-1345(+)
MAEYLDAEGLFFEALLEDKRCSTVEGTDFETAEGAVNKAARAITCPWRRRLSAGQALAAGVGAAIVVTCGIFLICTSSAVGKPSKLTARMLFESPAVHEVALENIWNIKARLPPSANSKHRVRRTVQRTFRDIIENMKEKKPEMWDALDTTELTQDEHDGVVRMMRFLKDPRVMRLGLAAAQALREGGQEGQSSAASAEEEAALQRRIIEKLRPHSGAVRQIFSEIPRSLHEFATSSSGDGFRSIFATKRRDLLKTIHGEGYHAFTRRGNPQVDKAFAFRSKKWRPDYLAHEVSGVVGSVVAQAECMLRIISPPEFAFPGDGELQLASMLTGGSAGADFALQLGKCDLERRDGLNGVEMYGCPMTTLIAGFDMLREPSALVDVLGAKKVKPLRRWRAIDDRRAKRGKEEDVQNVFPWCMLGGTHTC